MRPCVTGFGNVYERATYHAHPGDRAHLGWYPDPILDFLETADVKGDDVQSFWVRVKAPEGQAPGCYRGALVVSATRADGRRVSRRVPAWIRVNAFTLPRTSPLPLMIPFHPETSSTVFEREARRRIARDPKSPINIWRRHFAKWVDFLADHYITMSWLYGNDTAQMKDMYLPAWRRLREQGRLGAHCIGNWNYVPDGPDGEKTWREGMLATLRRRYEMARAEGFLDGAYLYGADEVTMKFIENCRRAAELLHEHIPGVPVVTTGCCQGGGVIHWAELLRSSPDVACDFLNAADVQAGKLAGYDVLVMPGGSGYDRYIQLGEAGFEKIRKYIRAGGHYYGTCAGIALALNDPKRLRLLPYTREKNPPRGGFSGAVKLNSRAEELLGVPAGTRYFRYHDGPLPAKGDPVPDSEYEVLATFDSHVMQKGKSVTPM